MGTEQAVASVTKAYGLSCAIKVHYYQRDRSGELTINAASDPRKVPTAL